MSIIDISKLSPAERKALNEQLANVEKSEKQTKKETRETFKELSQDFVKANIDMLVRHKKSVKFTIEKLFEDYKAIQKIKTMAYGTKEQDSHTSTLEDGSASIKIGYNVTISFDGTEASGVEKIKNFINSLADDDENTKKLSKMVNTFLKPNSNTKMLNPAKIIELSKLREEFNDEEFNDGLDIILDAQIRCQNSMYVSGWKMINQDGLPKKLEF